MADEMSLEEQKKLILPFMQRAQEVEKADPKVAYYCRMYAVEQALTITKRAKEVNSLISATISKLEKDKVALGVDKEQDKVHVEVFALRVFANADKVDRMGRADAGTARGFYAASCFIDVMNHFGALDNDMLSKQKYALWRAAEIRKAIREGRPPAAPPGTDTVPSSEDTEDLNLTNSSFLAAGGSSFREQPPAPQGPPPGLPTLPGTGYPAVGTSASQPFVPPPPQMPPPPPLMPSPSMQGAGAALLPGQRYKAGSPVLYCESMGIGSKAVERGTMGQVSTDPEGHFTYKVALKDRLVQANDMQVAPGPAEGSSVGYTQQPGIAAVPARVTMVNDMGWPPSYLVTLPDGSEVTAQAHQVSMIVPEDTGPAPQFSRLSQGPTNQQPGPTYPSLTQPDTPAAPPPPPPPPATTSQYSYAPPPGPAHAAPPPHPPPQPQWHAPPPAAAYSQPAQMAASGGIVIPALPPGHKPSVQAINEAQKAARTAVSSLNFEDAAAAVKFLSYAIQVLATPAGMPLPQLPHK